MVVPRGYMVEAIDWPVPHRKQVDGASSSIYEGSITAQVHVVPDGSPIDDSFQYTVHGSWQACNTRTGLCVRGSTVINSVVQ